MGLFTQNQQTNVSLQKRQSNFLAKTSLIAGFCFAIVFGASFLLSKYWLADAVYDGDLNLCYALGSVSLIVAIVMSIVISFKSNVTASSYGWLLGLFTVSYTLTFACYFSLFGSGIMFYSLAYTAIALFITALVAWRISDKAANTILKISMYSFFIYFFVAIIGSLIIAFTFTGIEWYWILVNALIGVAIICSNIYSFYQVKKVNEFAQMDTIDEKAYKILVLSIATNLLISIIQTFILILRMLLIFGRD